MRKLLLVACAVFVLATPALADPATDQEMMIAKTTDCRELAQMPEQKAGKLLFDVFERLTGSRHAATVDPGLNLYRGSTFAYGLCFKVGDNAYQYVRWYAGNYGVRKKMSLKEACTVYKTQEDRDKCLYVFNPDSWDENGEPKDEAAFNALHLRRAK